jgi:hypothetical protein
MTGLFIIPILAAIIFCGVKFVECYYIEKEKVVPLKDIVRDGMLVLLAAFVANGVVLGVEGHFKQFMNVVTDNKSGFPESVSVFTDTPGF